MLLVTYTGWTINDVLDLTVPQVNMLFAQMSKVPAPAVVLGAIMRSLQEKTENDSGSASAAENVTGGTNAFFAKLGIDTGG